jgi:hypothetical protein
MKNSWYLLLMGLVFCSCAAQFAPTRYSSPAYSTYEWQSSDTKNEMANDISNDALYAWEEMVSEKPHDKQKIKSRKLQEERKILYSGRLHLLVKNVDSTIAQVKRIAKEKNGYVSASGSNSTTIYVPADRLNETMQVLKKMGSVQSYQIESEDVTEKYFDMGIRLDNAKKARTRYLELLARAENVEAALKVEKELERLNGEIDVLEGKIKFWDHRLDYSPITIRYTEKKKLGILGWAGYGMYQTVKWFFILN